MDRIPEILAPCGNMSVLKAALSVGADACYLAGNSFGARAYAQNFTDNELIDAIELAHLYGAKLYLTCNTLIKNIELKNVYDMLRPLYEAGLDAVLVQDFGVMKLVREEFPDLPIHTSTQMNILTPEGVKLAKQMGAERVVAAREMTISEFRRIKEETDMELEVFVHGAMCLCYSGRCLMSSMAGGRSGNRGRCAQPCRQRYNGEYLLSMRDLCTLRYVPLLMDAGVDSLKIEGRMKNEYYVASAVDAYKQIALDTASGTYTEEKALRLEENLLEVFNRGGFSTGYMMRDRSERKWDEALIDSSMPGRRGVKVGSIEKTMDGKIAFKALKAIGVGDELLIDVKEPISITSNKDFKAGAEAVLNAPETRRISKGTNIFRTRSRKVTEEIEKLIDNPKKIPVTGKAFVRSGEEISLTLRYNDIDVTVTGPMAQEASNRPICDDTIRNKLSQMGNTVFTMEELEIDNDGRSFVRVGDISELRRSAVDVLLKRIAQAGRRDAGDKETFEAGNKETFEAENKETFEAENNNITGPGGTRMFSVSYPHQLKAVINLLPDNSQVYIILDTGLGGFDKKALYDAADTLQEISKDKKNVKILLGLAYINRGEYDAIGDYGKLLEGVNGTDGIDGLYIRNIDDLAAVREHFTDKIFMLSNSLYTYNDMAATELLDILRSHTGKVIFETSIELTLKEALAIDYRSEHISMYYGKLPLMVTSGLRDTKGRLKDDKSYTYDVIRAKGYCYNVLLSGLPLSMHGTELDNMETSKLYFFTDETEEEVRDVLSDNPKYIAQKRYTRGHFEKGI